MQVDQITFGQKRYITPQMRENIREILTQMNNRSIYTEYGDIFESSVLNSISTKNNKIKLFDMRKTLRRLPENHQMIHETKLNIEKTSLVIDNNSGEIIAHHKPFFRSWKKIMRQFDESLKFFRDNFDNQALVTQHRGNLMGFTHRGTQNVNNLR